MNNHQSSTKSITNTITVTTTTAAAAATKTTVATSTSNNKSYSSIKNNQSITTAKIIPRTTTTSINTATATSSKRFASATMARATAISFSGKKFSQLLIITPVVRIDHGYHNLKEDYDNFDYDDDESEIMSAISSTSSTLPSPPMAFMKNDKLNTLLKKKTSAAAAAAASQRVKTKRTVATEYCSSKKLNRQWSKPKEPKFNTTVFWNCCCSVLCAIKSMRHPQRSDRSNNTPYPNPYRHQQVHWNRNDNFFNDASNHVMYQL
jgi:hypothetical protein